jgi:hypothetical protein
MTNMVFTACPVLPAVVTNPMTLSSDTVDRARPVAAASRWRFERAAPAHTLDDSQRGPTGRTGSYRAAHTDQPDCGHHRPPRRDHPAPCGAPTQPIPVADAHRSHRVARGFSASYLGLAAAGQRAGPTVGERLLPASLAGRCESCLTDRCWCSAQPGSGRRCGRRTTRARRRGACLGATPGPAPPGDWPTAELRWLSAH